MRLLSIAGHDLGTTMSLRVGRRSEGGGSVAKLLALQARPSLSWAHGRRDAGVEASGSGRSSVGDDGYDPLELEDETESSGSSLTLGPTVDWLEFKHEVQVNRGLVVETTAKGDKETVVDFHVKAKRTDELNGSMSILDLASNLDNAHRVTLETTNFTDDHGSSVQCTVSTPIPVRPRPTKGGHANILPSLDWGLATHRRVGENLSVFSRLFSDDVYGQQLVVQASYHVRDRDRGAWDGEGRRSQLLLSALGALNFGADIGGGFSVTKLFPREGKSADGSSADSVELRALCAKSGNHSLSVNASFGVV